MFYLYVSIVTYTQGTIGFTSRGRSVVSYIRDTTESAVQVFETR